MKQSTATKTLLAIITILTVMMALIVPSPVYAKELPPPPPPPSNDTGGKGHGSSSHSSSKDLPANTTVVVTNNGTPMSLAAQLTVNALTAPASANVATNYVKFCKSDNTDVLAGDCTSYKTIQNAIDAVAKIKNADASGIFYVDLGYATPLPNITKFTPIVLDQSKFSTPNLNGTLNLQMLGGYNFVTGTQGGPTSLIQSFNIKKINDQSSFYMENFVFNVNSLLQDGISVTDSNHVTLKNITVNDSAVLGGNGINIENSNDVALDTVNVNRSGGLAGDGISIKNSGSLNGAITLENVNVTNTNSLLGDGLQITGSQNIHMDNVSASSTQMYGAYLKDNSGGLVIDNSAFNNSGYAGLYVTGQNGPVVLNNVTADNNGRNVEDTSLLPFKFLFPDLAAGAAFVNNSGSLIINDSEFNGNATAGLWVQNQTGNAPVGDALTEMSGNNSIVLLNGVDAYGNGISPYTHSVPIVGTIFDNLGWSGGAFIDSDSGSVVANDSNFSGNFGAGLEAYATRGNIILKNVTATSNTGDGAVLNTVLDLTDGLDIGTGRIIVTGDEDRRLNGGGPRLMSQFSGNGKSGLVAMGGEYTGVFNTVVASNRSNGAFLNGLGLIGLFGDDFVGNAGNGLNANAGLGLRVDRSRFLGNNGNGLTALSLGNIDLEDSDFVQNRENGASAVSLFGNINAENDNFISNGENGLTATSLGNIYLADVNAGANRENGAVLTSVLGDVNVFSGAFGTTSGGINDAAGNPIVRTKGNGENGLVINTLAGDVTLGGETDRGTLNNYGEVDANQNGANGIVVTTHSGDIYAQNVFTEQNDILGAMLVSADGSVNVRDSSFDNNGVGGLLGLSLRSIMLGNVDASGNGLFGAATLSAGRTGIFDSTFDSNGGVGLLSVGLGPILADNVDANNNGLLGAGLVSVNPGKPEDFAKKDDRSCSGRPGDVCVNQMTANGNGFIGAAMLGTNTVEVDNSLFTGNGDLGPLGGVIPGGGLVAIGGESTVLDQVQANKNFGFGAVVGNTGGVYDLLTSMIDDTNNTASAISQAVGGPATALDLSYMPFSASGDVVINRSDFSRNEDFGLLAISDGDVTLHNVIANANADFGAAVLAEGNVDINHAHFIDNEGFGLFVSIFSPDANVSANNPTHTVTLNDVTASYNGTWGALIQANTTDKVDVSVTDSSFNRNEGEAYFGLGIDTTGDVFVEHVTGNENDGDGAVISGNTVTIRKSHFNFNDQIGLVVSSLAATITHTNVCWNKGGPDNVSTNSLFTDDFQETCPNDDNVDTTVETTQPWQTVKVMTDPGKNVATLSCQYGTTFLYMEKQNSSAPDFEWARAVMSPCIVANDSVGTFVDLNEGGLPAALPAGFTYQGKAFDLSITGPNGQAIDTLGGPMMVRFTLPEGFTLPAGKKLDILWFDPSTNKWVELTTFNSASYAWAFAANDGTFVLTIK